MAKRLLPALSIGILVLLIGNIAYSAERRKNTIEDQITERKQEEDRLLDELLIPLEKSKQKNSVVPAPRNLKR